MNIIFLMDTLADINPYKDSTYMLMLGAHRKGYRIFYAHHTGMSLHEGQVLFDVQEVIPSEDRLHPFHYHETSTLMGGDVAAVFIRTDPPFDEAYLMNTWMLDRLPSQVKVFNSPHGIRTVNEKVWATQFTSIIPSTLVTADITRAKEFLAKHKKIVAKPSNAFGGASVFIVQSGDTNASVIFETLSNLGRNKMILQAYIPAAEVGDKRILLLNGDPLGAVLRVHSATDHRNNFFAGGKPQSTEITPRDLEIIDVLKPHLNKLGLAFVGIDIIGGYLIEVNVTSPTCIQEINLLQNTAIENSIIDQLLGD